MDDQSQNWHGASPAVSTSTRSGAASQARNDESWVEIASQPSSSSLSSIGDEIVTTGLRVNGTPARRRRSYPARYPFHNHQGQFQGNSSAVAGGGMSSEYEASESEEDRNLASSTENIPTQLPSLSRLEAPPTVESATEDEDDDDENATALGPRRRSNDHTFRPQPNAFSNPPAGMMRAQRSHSMNAASSSALPSRHPHSPVARRPLGTRTQTRVRQPNYMSPSYQADNDAALRASLTTLLSCAAAARGLQKTRDDEAQKSSPASAGVGPSNQPVELRLVPESELMAEDPPPAAAPATDLLSQAAPLPRRATTPSARSSSRASSDKGKRTAAAPARSSRASKKKRTAVTDDALISPTLMTWVVSAGVVVLVSVVGFGAGYVIGREVGRQEGLLSAEAGASAASLNISDASCGRDVMRSSTGGGLRRWRWGTSMRTAVA